MINEEFSNAVMVESSAKSLNKEISGHVRYFNFWNFNGEVKIKLHEGQFEDLLKFRDELQYKDLEPENSEEIKIQADNFIIIFYK